MIKKKYGVMKIKKGSILYHSSDEKFKEREKPMLFCTLHPSEWASKYVSYVKLKKDILLLFMIDIIKRERIFSSLNILSNHPSLNLAKKNDENLNCYVRELRKEKLDGWFTSIENKTSVEIAIINDKEIYEVEKTERLTRNWRNGNCLNNEKTIKNWGNKYKICSIERPIKLKINLKYKDMIKEYKRNEKKSGYPLEYIFQVILENAKIFYHKYENNNEEIKWKC